MPRGRSGSSPRMSAAWNARSCPGITETIGARSSGTSGTGIAARPARADPDHRAPAAHEVAGHGAHLGLGARPGRRHEDDGKVFLGHHDRAVLEIGGRKGLGEEERELLQLQRDLERRRVVHASREDDGPLRVREPPRRAARGGLGRQGLPHGVRHGRERVELLLPPRERQDEEGDGRELGRVGLRRRDASLRARVKRQHVVRRARERALGVVHDRERRRPLRGARPRSSRRCPASDRTVRCR